MCPSTTLSAFYACFIGGLNSYVQGDAAFADKKLSEAAKYYNQIVEGATLNANIKDIIFKKFIALGDAAFADKKYSEAYTYYTAASKNAPSNITDIMFKKFFAVGNAAFVGGYPSQAERCYSSALDCAPPNVNKTDIYVLLGMSIENQVSQPSLLEGFTIDTNKIERSFNETANKLLSNPYLVIDQHLGGLYKGYNDERSRLDKAYKDSDTEALDRALANYNQALSLDPKNEQAMSNAEYVRWRKTYISSLYSPNNTALDNIKTYLDQEVKKLKDQQFDIKLGKLTQSMNQFANSLAQVLQNQRGGSYGGGSGGGQVQNVGGNSSGNSSGGGSSHEREKCRRCGGSGKCGKCKDGTATSWSSYTSEQLFYKCSICKGTGKCYECNGSGYRRR